VRILFWSQTFLPTVGGAEVLGYELARALRRRGHEVHVVSNLPPGSSLPSETVTGGVPVQRFAMSAPLVSGDAGGILREKHAVERCKAEFEPDVVHVLLFGVDLVVHRLTAGDVPEVATLQQPVIPLYWRSKSYVGATLAAARWLVAPSEATLRSYRPAVPDIDGRSSVILNSLPLPAVTPALPAPGEPRIVCAGRLEVQKGFDLAIAALARLRRRHPALRLVVAGDGPARPALEHQAALLGVSGAVDFLGWLAPGDVPGLLMSASVVVMPSRDHELFGLVALQAAQVARPIVASSLGGLCEVIADGVTGVLVPPDDEAALAAAVGALLEDPCRAQAIGAAARRRAVEQFSWDRFVGAYEAIYAGVVGRSSPCDVP
jgi:glycogen(starch) synthase